MTRKILIATISILAFASCHNNSTQDTAKQEIPKALEDKSSGYEIVSKRAYDDLVENLYNELVSKNMDLKKLEEQIDALKNSETDSTYLFTRFNEKNQSYFNAANRHIAAINDSLLRGKMKIILTKNITKYNSSISRHTELLKIIDAKNLTISDLHHILKIIKTLPLIEKYQNENVPNPKSLEGFIKQQDETIKRTDTLTKK